MQELLNLKWCIGSAPLIDASALKGMQVVDLEWCRRRMDEESELFEHVLAHPGSVRDYVDGDDRTDLLVSDGDGGIIVYSGDSRGGFARTRLETHQFGDGPMALVSGNFTGGVADGFAYSLISMNATSASLTTSPSTEHDPLALPILPRVLVSSTSITS